MPPPSKKGTTRCFANWSSNRYYLGRVNGMEGDKMKINYDDGDKKDVNPRNGDVVAELWVPFLFNLSSGVRVIAQTSERRLGKFFPGTISATSGSDITVTFDDEETHGTNTIKQHQLYLLRSYEGCFKAGRRVWINVDESYVLGVVLSIDGNTITAVTDSGIKGEYSAKSTSLVPAGSLPRASALRNNTNVIGLEGAGNVYYTKGRITGQRVNNQGFHEFQVTFTNGNTRWNKLFEIRTLDQVPSLTMLQPSVLNLNGSTSVTEMEEAEAKLKEAKNQADQEEFLANSSELPGGGFSEASVSVQEDDNDNDNANANIDPEEAQFQADLEAALAASMNDVPQEEDAASVSSESSGDGMGLFD